MGLNSGLQLINHKKHIGGNLKSITAIFIAAFLLNTSAFAQYKLEYKASGSAPLRYDANTTLQTVESMMGQEAKVSVKSYQHITMTSTKAGAELLYNITVDSSRNVAILPNGDTTTTSSPSVGQIKQTTVRPDGEEISSKWLDTTFAKTQAGQTKDFGSFFFRLPAKEVTTGSTWTQEKVDTVATGGGEGSIFVSTVSNYKLIDKQTVEGIPCVKITFTGTVGLKGATTYQGIEFAIKGTGKISGTAFFDYTNGKVVRIKGSSEQDLTMASSGQQKMTIPMTQRTDYDLLLLK